MSRSYLAIHSAFSGNDVAKGSESLRREPVLESCLRKATVDAVAATAMVRTGTSWGSEPRKSAKTQRAQVNFLCEIGVGQKLLFTF
jgi:hypothetical protein